MKKVIANRHSVRVFTGEPIEEGVMEEILGYSLVYFLFIYHLALSYIDEYTALQNDSCS